MRLVRVGICFAAFATLALILFSGAGLFLAGVAAFPYLLLLLASLRRSFAAFTTLSISAVLIAAISLSTFAIVAQGDFFAVLLILPSMVLQVLLALFALSVALLAEGRKSLRRRKCQRCGGTFITELDTPCCPSCISVQDHEEAADAIARFHERYRQLPGP